MKKNFGTFLIILSGILWGTMGLFVHTIHDFGLSSMQIVCLRLSVAALLYILVLVCVNPKGFRVRLKDIPLFLGMGICSVFIFTWCYFTAITMLPMSVAAVLLYTSPIWVMLMSMLFFKERMTVIKLVALVLAFGGCVGVSGFGGGPISPSGFLFGICSGIGYGLYSIFGTVAVKRYSSLTITAYSFSIAAICTWFFSKPQEMIHLITASNSVKVYAFIVLCGIVTGFIPYLCYTKGLETVKASRAAVLATVEPVVATICGTLVYQEKMTVSIAVGIVLILTAILVLSVKKEKV